MAEPLQPPSSPLNPPPPPPPRQFHAVPEGINPENNHLPGDPIVNNRPRNNNTNANANNNGNQQQQQQQQQPVRSINIFMLFILIFYSF